MPCYRRLALAMLAVAGLAAAGTTEAGRAAPLTPYQQDMIRRFKDPSPYRHAQGRCGSAERECQIDMIFWCCRRDQQCGYRYAGECR